MASNRLDRTKFKAQTAEEASDHAGYYKPLTWKERLKIAGYLNSNVLTILKITRQDLIELNSVQDQEAKWKIF